MAIGISCLVLRVHSTTIRYVLKSFASLANYNKERVKKVELVASWTNNILALLQALLLVGTCLYCIAISGMVVHSNEVRGLF